MAFQSKNRDQIVYDITNAILDKIPEIDFSDGEPLKTFIEAIVEEIDLQYWQLEQIYQSSFIDTAYGEDLTRLAKLMSVDRLQATSSYGKVKFYRDTPAASDHFIPVGTLVESLPDINGNTVRFETTENVTLLTNEMFVIANIKSINTGAINNLPQNKIKIINNPPMGIESVVNEEAIIGGEDEETDENLRNRVKNALDTAGLGTINAIRGKVESIPGIKSVKVIDVARGIGTIDILILGDVLPLPVSKIEELNNAIQEIKAGGIDFRIIEPTIVPSNVKVKLEIKNNKVEALNLATQAVNDYFASLQIGDSFKISQLSKKILESSVDILDISVLEPIANVIINNSSIISAGNITITGDLNG